VLPEIAFRPVQPDECCQVVALHRRVFSPEQVARTIYASSRVDLYLANLLAFPQLQRGHMLWGAWDGDNLVGYAHSKALPETWHLNYIAVSPEYRGCGIGRMLWAHWVQVGQQRGCRKLSLDVERENQRALDWYRRQGLRIVGTVWMYEKDIKRSTASNHEAGAVRLLDWEQSEAWQLAYGFSEFRLVYREFV
jgi:ribosomal protein S18 acetylase RimI-like enzyme